MMKKFTIWDSDISMEDWKDFIEEECPDLSEEEQYLRVCEMNDMYLEDEMMNLDKELEHDILVLADLGLWRGRISAFKIIPGNLKQIFFSGCDSPSDRRYYCDGHDICCREAHHDGVNYYRFREIRRPIERLTEKLYLGEPVSARSLNYYTRSLAKDVAAIYGI